MPGVPKSLTDAIGNALKTITSKRSQVSPSEATTPAGQDAAVLKNQLTAAVAKSLATQIDALAAANAADFATNQAAICAAYAQVAGSVATTKPASCP